MFQKIIRDHRQAFILNFIIIFLSISIVYLGVTLFFQSSSNKFKQVEIRAAEESLVSTEKYFITYKVNRLVSDLEFASDTLRDYFPNNGDFSDVQSIWLAFSNRRGVYDQIRYLDLSGDEIVRVNYLPQGAYVVAQDNLQNKKDRYYFQETLSLDENWIYISPLDLNIENNQIEQPLKPVIRLGTPFYLANGEKSGIVVLNYSANDILAQVKTIASTSNGSVFLLNADGYWIYNQSAPEKEWAFQYDTSSTISFASEYPEEWSAIQGNDSGTLSTKNGLFCYAKLLTGDLFQSGINDDLLSCEADNLYVVTFVPASSPQGAYFANEIHDLLRQVLQQYYLFYFIILIFAGILSVFIVSNRSKSEQVKYFSEFDVMTNTYNRRAGVAKLNTLYKTLPKDCRMASVCFLDVNGLKQVNDVLGHEAGDELLITVANTIRKNIRTGDFIVRLGGDEFLIVFTSIGEELAEKAWERIVSEFDIINQTENRKYIISVSHGIQATSCSVEQALEIVLHQADTKMYDEKKQLKGTVQILR